MASTAAADHDRPVATSPSPAVSESHARDELPRLPIRTYHCSFCNQILLATTRDVSRLPHRGGDALDRAAILPLKAQTRRTRKEKKRGRGKQQQDEETRREEVGEDQDQDENEEEEDEEDENDEDTDSDGHYTILLSTTSPSSAASIVRRQDGFEKRLMLRCGRCRLVCGYVLDKVHFPDHRLEGAKQEEEEEDGDGGGDGDSGEEGGKASGDEDVEVVYILPGAVVETGDMMRDTENKVDAKEWEGWERLVPAS